MPASTAPAVLVTGASSGIGRACALELATQGFRVFAAVRQPQHERDLRAASPNIEPLILDVTRPELLEAAFKRIEDERGAAGLQGLVNNAGIVVSGPIELLELDELRRQLEVNVVGQVAVTQRFLPAIRAGRGRIVNVTSMGGYLALPFAGAYAASKFAMEAITDSLRRELRPWGIEVIAIEPGAVESAIWDKSFAQAEAFLAELSESGRALYGAAGEAMVRATRKTARAAVPAQAVARRVHQALTARRPRTRYRVGRDAAVAWRLTRWLPDRVMDALVARMTGTPPRSA